MDTKIAELNATIKIELELFRPKKYKDGFWYVVLQGKDKFIGLAKKEPFSCDTPDPVIEPGELWFELGETPMEAFHAIVVSKKK